MRAPTRYAEPLDRVLLRAAWSPTAWVADCRPEIDHTEDTPPTLNHPNQPHPKSTNQQGRPPHDHRHRCNHAAHQDNQRPPPQARSPRSDTGSRGTEAKRSRVPLIRTQATAKSRVLDALDGYHVVTVLSPSWSAPSSSREAHAHTDPASCAPEFR